MVPDVTVSELTEQYYLSIELSIALLTLSNELRVRCNLVNPLVEIEDLTRHVLNFVPHDVLFELKSV